MYKCEVFKKLIGPNLKENKLIVETRPRSYYTVLLKHRTIKHLRYEQYIEKDERALANLERLGWKVLKEKYSKGTEIARELITCKECSDEKSEI